jgi:hypothetical protein
MEEFIKLLSGYSREAFRLETLSVYDVSQERETFDVFLKTGEIIQNQKLMDYIQEHAEKISQGKKHIRGRVMPNPMTDYFIYETK